MDAMEAILTRRSIRRYTAAAVSEPAINELLKAAMSAPSASNQQPWHFVVINERQILSRVSEYHPYAQMLPQAQVAILVCGDLMLEKSPGYWVQDCAAATENILIAARASGLGAVWLGIYPREERVRATRELFRLPQHVMPLSLVAIGYPAEQKPPSDRYSISRIHYNRW